jgi:glycosyltransferase involved in cell wall biosynthesis
MTLTIITVVYNNVSTLEDAINSIKNQTCFDKIQYIIVDGGSTDGTIELINKHKQYIDIFISEKDNGIYDAMNKGLKLATGDVIGILNSDDLYANNSVLHEVLTQFESDTDLDILYGNLVYVKNDNINKIVRFWKSKPYYPKFFENGNVPPHPSLFLSAKVYKEAGYFNLQYRLASDYEFMLRIFKKFNFKFKFLPKIFVYMRLGGATNNSLKNIYKGNTEILKSWKENGYPTPLFLIPKRIYKRLIQFL